jgi:hypothetical protein
MLIGNAEQPLACHRPNRCGKPLLDFFISELVQFFF